MGLGQLSGREQLDHFKYINSFHSKFVETEVAIVAFRMRTMHSHFSDSKQFCTLLSTTIGLQNILSNN